MKIGSIDISEYNARVLTFAYTPAAVTNTTVLPYNSMFPLLTDTEISPGQLAITIHVRGATTAAAEANVAALMFLLYRQAEIDLDDGYVYRCTFTSFSTARRMETLLEIVITLSAVRHKALVTLPLIVGTNTISCSSTVATQCKINITPDTGADSCTVFGITINDLTVGKTIIIDGMRGLVTEDGINKYLDTDLVTFPMLQPGNTTVSVSGNVIANLQYYPTFL